MLETEVSNTAAIALYLRLGFLKDKRLQRCLRPCMITPAHPLLRYYMNGGDAFRLKVWLRD
jgi:peptide alpha-N-acetyltransferase